jgi:putative cell wall-binding protein
MRRLLPLVILLGVLVPVRPATAAELPVVWERALGGAAVRESSPALVDLDGSGTLDVLVGSRGDGRLYAFDGRGGGDVAGWPQATSNPINSSPAVADVTGDGRPEVFVGSGVDGERTGALYSLADEGGTRWRGTLTDPDFPQGAPVRSSPALGDIDGDGRIEATAGSLGVRSLWSFHGVDGVAIGGRELFYWDDTIFSSAALADVDGDGRVEAIVGGDSSPGAPIDHRGGMVRAIGGDGRQRWEFLTDDIIRSSPAVGDIDGDGKDEVVFGVGDFWHGRDAIAVFALDAATGRLKWRRETDGVTNSSPALADIDGDGRLDVAVGTFDSGALGKRGGSVYALRGTDGSDLRGFPQSSGGGVVLGGITTADVNGDGAQDLFVPTGAFIAVFDGKTGLRDLNLAEGRGIAYQSSAAIADVDGDGRLDVVAAGTRTDGSGIVTRWQLPPSARLGSLGWHQFRKDGRRTGSWTTGVPDAGAMAFDRVAGGDRYETAAALSQGATSGATAYVATGASFADALAGGPAAALRHSAVLLVGKDSVPSSTSARLRALKPTRIAVLGGPAAVSDSVVVQHSQIAPTTRLAGSDRYGTAAAVSADAFGPGVPVVYVATGNDFPDALAGGAAAAKQGGPVLLVDRDGIPQSTSLELRRLLPREIVVLGGTGVVSASVESQLHAYAVLVSRLAGPDRYATAVAVSKRISPTSATVFVATGRNFPDALAGSAATNGSPLLLVPYACVPGVVRDELGRLGATKLTLLGGNAAVRGTVAALTSCS